jgi:hypothetical protein
MIKINRELERKIKEQADHTFDLIVRTNGDATPHLPWLAAAGLQVTQQFKLSPGVAVSGAGYNALKLLDQDWVVSIDLDAPVKTM